MTSVQRQTPLRAGAPAPAAPPTAPRLPDDEAIDALGVGRRETPPQTDEDRRAFRDAVRSLRTAGNSLKLSERILMLLAGIVAPLGLLLVMLGWYGASHTSNLFEQIPYLISGGLFGLGLVFLGAFFYFAHWMTELVKESRAGSAALLEAIGRLQDSIDQRPGGRVPVVADVVDLVATSQGSMAHRGDCAVVVGKHDLRPVAVADGLAPCKMCDPYEGLPPGSLTPG